MFKRWLFLLLVGGLCFRTSVSEARPAPLPFDFKGRLLVALSDADMVASAYANDKLGSAEGADALSVVRLNAASRRASLATVPISDSVTGPPTSVVVTPDGKYAIVIEVRGKRQPRAAPKMSALPLGHAIYVVSLVHPDQPRIVQHLRTFAQPYSASINSQGSLLAVSFGPLGASKKTPLAFYRFKNGRLSAPLTPSIPGWSSDSYLADIEFHPHKNVLALLRFSKATLSFVEVTSTKAGLKLSPWGNAVDVDKSPFLVRFSPDGRCALINGTKVPGTTRGSVSCVRLETSHSSDGSPQHKLVSRAQTGVIPEGLTVSPDGRWVVTVNLERSWEPLNSPSQGFFSSLTLMRLEPTTGTLQRVGDFPFDGVLPESAVFDNSSRFLAVTQFDYFDQTRKGGAITFWRLAGDKLDPKRAELVKLNTTIPVARGPHTIVLVR